MKPTPPHGPRVILIGPPGAGKSTIGEILAQNLGQPWRDTDHDIELTTKKSIPEIFKQHGEATFREIEQQVVQRAIVEHPGVLTLGGGAILSHKTQNQLNTYSNNGGTIVYIELSEKAAEKRLNTDHNRPLLNGENPVKRWKTLVNQRRGTYEKLATLKVQSDCNPPIEVAHQIQQHLLNKGKAMTTTRIAVNAEHTYEVIIGKHLLSEIPKSLGDKAQRVLIIHPGALENTATKVKEELEKQGYDPYVAVIPEAEEAKKIEVVAFAWKILGQSGFTRSDAIIAIGGGATTDVAGFIAATWLRGISVIQVPTTLLAMVDAAVGGKTGINTNEGKNLVGAFHSPKAVICDLAALQTLPTYDFIAGLAEIIKTGFIADPVIIDLIEHNANDLRHWPQIVDDHMWKVIREIVERAISVKAKVVSSDLKEAGLREILNYGHTFGHAIEKIEKYTWRHGAAVAVGMMYAAELARLAGKIDDELVEKHRTLLQSVGLPTTYKKGRWEQLHDAMKIDKKTRGNLLRFVILDPTSNLPIRLEGPDPALLVAAYESISEEA